MQDILALAGVTTKLLAKKLTHVGFVVHNHDADAHYTASAAAARPLRGSRTVNSVKSPTSLSTVIMPPCCWVTISQLIDSPSPVPSPVGLVVKNGWNSLSRSSGAMPVPLSRIRISTASPRSRVHTLRVGLNS